MHIKIIGAGLAGCEAALWLAGQGVQVTLYEQKPVHFSPAHKSAGFAELICSNSLKAERLDSASGLLKEEMRRMGSQPAARRRGGPGWPPGGALAVDRDAFSARVTALVEAHPNITVRREEAVAIDEAEPVLIATGPLTEGALANAIARLTGDSRLHFYDAVAPIVTAASLDYGKGVRGVPLRPGGGGLFELPLQQGRVRGVPCGPGGRRAGPPPRVRQGGPGRPRSRRRGQKGRRRHRLRGLHAHRDHGRPGGRHHALRPPAPGGPHRPTHRPPPLGQRPAAGRKPGAHPVQHRRLSDQPQVGGAEERVFSMIPGLEQAEFVRYGVMHRNTFLDAPRVLTPGLYLKAHPNVFFAGQITGFEGYMESAASGLLAARSLYARLTGRPYTPPPPDTMCGALMQYLTAENKHFQPMGANMGILPPLADRPRDKRLRYMAQAERAVASFQRWLDEQNQAV